MVKTVAFEQDAREALKHGVSQLARTVRTTLGPRSRNVLIEDLVKAGVIDATKVVRCALENAASVAMLLLTSAAVIAEPSHTEKVNG